MQPKNSDKPRERLLNHGVETLSDIDLLSAIIGSGIHKRPVGLIAREVLTVLDRQRRLQSENLRDIRGLGPAGVCAIVAALELARRTFYPHRHRIAVPADILPVIDHYADRKQEYFLCVSLNGAHEVLAVRIVSVGLVNRTIVHPREVFADAIVDRAAAVVVAHNHPSGNIEPSTEDREVTRRLVAAGQMLGISVLDHIVFSRNGYYSFVENGDMPD